MPLLLTANEVETLLTAQDCVEALDGAYRDLARGRAGYRPRSDLYSPHPSADAFYRLRSMEGVSAAAGVAAIRIGSDVVRWFESETGVRQQHVPAARDGRWVGLVLLFDIQTSEPLLIFPDGPLQRLRVGATSAIAARCLARPDSHVLGVLGSGNQARCACLAMAAVFALHAIRVYSPTPRRRRAFAAELEQLAGVEVQAVDEPRDAVRGADLVACATNSLDPVLPAAWLEPGMHVGAIEWCEVEEEVFRRADRTVVHVRGGEVHNHLAGVDAGSVTGLHKHDMAPWMRALPGLSEVLSEDVPGRTSEREITCFVNNVGCGLQFAAVGRRLLDLARQRGVGRELPAEWFLQDTPS